MKISKMYAALLASWGQMGIIGGIVRVGSESGGQMPPEIPFQSFVQRPLRSTAALTLTEKEHAGQTQLADAAAGFTYTLPRATGSGAKYRFRVNTTITSVGLKIVVSNTDDQMIGIIYSTLVGTPTTNNGWPATAASAYDTITLNGTTTGGIIGDWVEVEDVKQGIFAVSGCIQQSGSAATPFSATV